MAEKNGNGTKSNRKSPPTLSDRYLKMALKMRKLDEEKSALKKSMQLIEEDAAAGKVHTDQVELPIRDDSDEARA